MKSSLVLTSVMALTEQRAAQTRSVRWHHIASFPIRESFPSFLGVGVHLPNTSPVFSPADLWLCP